MEKPSASAAYAALTISALVWGGSIVGQKLALGAFSAVETSLIRGIGALAPTGEADDLQFLAGAIEGLKARGQVDLLDNAWLAIHNYQGDLSLDDTKGYSRYLAYADVLRQSLGRVLPMVSTEGGGFARDATDEARQTQAVLGAYQRVASPNAPNYLFNYTYWVIANAEGGGHDPAWEWQALFQNGHTSPLVDALKNG